MAVYWISMVCTSYLVTEFVFGRWLIGTKTVLDDDDAKRLEVSRHQAKTCPGLVNSILFAGSSQA
jgi:hypothetical protein